MTQENTTPTEDKKQDAPAPADNKATAPEGNDDLDAIKRERDALKAKNLELLDETKNAKKKAAEEARRHEEAKQEKLKKDGDYEQLFKSAEQKTRELEEQIRIRDERAANEIARNEAMKLATQLADGHNAELLQEFIVRRIKYTEDGIRVLDSNGGLTVSSLADLKREFETSDKFKSLIRGSKATGGGASGTSGGASSASVNRKTFDSWNYLERDNFMKNKGTVTD